MDTNTEAYEDLDSTIVLCDDEGNEVTMEFIDVIEYEGKEYVVLLPQADGDTPPEESEVAILEIAEENGEEVYFGVEDDDLLDKLFAVFKEKYKDILNFEK